MKIDDSSNPRFGLFSEEDISSFLEESENLLADSLVRDMM
jgi:hypothetical protein